MSKKKNISYLFGLAFLLLAGCDTDTATVPLPDDGERAVEVPAEGIGMHRRDYRRPERH